MMRRVEIRTRTHLAALAASCFLIAPAAHGEAPPLSPRLSPLRFLLGAWTGDKGHAEGGQAARGTFTIEAAAGGRALLRRDHTQVLGPDGRVAQTIEQIMLVYPEGGQLHGDYFDGVHAIHYADATVTPNERVRFTTAETPGAPAFRLTYGRLPANRLSIMFEMRAPSESAYRTVAEGSAHREVKGR